MIDHRFDTGARWAADTGGSSGPGELSAAAAATRKYLDQLGQMEKEVKAAFPKWNEDKVAGYIKELKDRANSLMGGKLAEYPILLWRLRIPNSKDDLLAQVVISQVVEEAEKSFSLRGKQIQTVLSALVEYTSKGDVTAEQKKWCDGAWWTESEWPYNGDEFFEDYPVPLISALQNEQKFKRPYLKLSAVTPLDPNLVRENLTELRELKEGIRTVFEENSAVSDDYALNLAAKVSNTGVVTVLLHSIITDSPIKALNADLLAELCDVQESERSLVEMAIKGSFLTRDVLLLTSIEGRDLMWTATARGATWLVKLLYENNLSQRLLDSEQWDDSDSDGLGSHVEPIYEGERCSLIALAFLNKNFELVEFFKSQGLTLTPGDHLLYGSNLEWLTSPSLESELQVDWTKVEPGDEHIVRALATAAQNGKEPELSALFAGGLDPNYRYEDQDLENKFDSDTFVSLFPITHSKNERIAKIFIDNGATLEGYRGNYNGVFSAVDMLGVLERVTEILGSSSESKDLIEKFAPKAYVLELYKEALGSSSGHGDADLLEFGAHLFNGVIGMYELIDVPGADGKTILMLTAEEEDDPAEIERLINLGANLDLRDDCGRTPLMLAAARKRENVVEYLINECVVDPRETDIAGLTASDHAKQAGHTTLAKHLQDDIDSWNSTEQSNNR